jgi:hypothetical protein
VKLGVLLIKASRVAVGAEVGVRVSRNVGVKLTVDEPLFDTVLEGEAVMVYILELLRIPVEVVVFVTGAVAECVPLPVPVLEL